MNHKDYYEVSEEARLLKLAQQDKRELEESLARFREFQRHAYTDGIKYELSSIEKFYKAKLYDLRHIDIDS